MATIDIVFNTLMTIWEVVKWTWWIFFIGWIFYLKVRWKSYPLEVIIIEKRGDNLIKTNDGIGKYNDKFTNVTGYKLLKAKETMPVLNFEWILHNSYKSMNFLEKFLSILRTDIGTVFLFKYGTKQYKPIEIKVNGKVKMINQPIKDKDGNEVMVNVYEQIDPRNHLGAIDFEVVDWDNMNFMTQEQRASILRREKSGNFMTKFAVPIIIIVCAVIVSIVMMKFSMDQSAALRNSGACNPIQNQATENTPATVPNIPVISDLIPGT